MIYTKNQKLNLSEEDGIWCDYSDHTWLFMVKDRIWQKEEIERCEHADITVTFFQKGIVDGFLLEIFDCLESSDLPFCIKDADESFIQSLNDKQDYSYEAVLINEDNTVAAVRSYPFSHENSNLIKEKLRQRLPESYTSDDFDKAYAALSNKYEPYELEQFAIFQQKDSRRKK